MAQWPRLEIVVIGDQEFGQLLAAQGHHVVTFSQAALLRQPIPAAQLYLIDVPDSELGSVLAEVALPSDVLVGVHSFGSFAALDNLVGLSQSVFVFAYLGTHRCIISAPEDVTGQVAELFFTEALLDPLLVPLSQYPAVTAKELFPVVCELVSRAATDGSAILPPRLDEESAVSVCQWLPEDVQPLFSNMIAYLL